MGWGGGGGAPRQDPGSGRLVVADTWAPPRAAWLSPCRCCLGRGRPPRAQPRPLSSTAAGTHAQATHICRPHVSTTDAATGTLSSATCTSQLQPPAALPPAQAPCVAEATSPSQMALVTCLGGRADSAPESRGQATAALSSLQHHRGRQSGHGQGGHGTPGGGLLSQLFLWLSPAWVPRWPGPCTS